MNLLNLSNSHLRNCVHAIIRQLNADGFKPDYIVGVTRGGLIPAVMISHYLKVPMHTLKVSLLEGSDDDCESNLWMSEDAFGYVPKDEQEIIKCRWDSTKKKKILIVDDINDTGATFNWIKKDWQSSCLPNEDLAWKHVWKNNVRFATLVDNESSNFHDVKYSGMSINKTEDPDIWVNFPWESWWED